jgi:hypothetical protein
MSPRRPDTSPVRCKDTPGPGSYNQTQLYSTFNNPGVCKIGTSKRRNLHNADLSIPGPEKYELRNSMQQVFKTEPKPIFGSSERSKSNF